MLLKSIKAIICAVWRAVVKPIKGIVLFVGNKFRYHGKVRFTASVRIDPSSTFEGADSIGDRSTFSGSMGYGSYMCEGCKVEGSIGRFTSIGSELRTVRGVHPMEAPFATSSPMFYSLKKQTMTTFATEQRFEEMHPPVLIGNDCWIGVRVFMVGGVRIGDGAVVLSGAVVTKDVPPYAIVGGIPAKVIKYRYDEETIAWLLEKKWWNMPKEWLKENSTLLCNIDELKKAL